MAFQLNSGWKPKVVKLLWKFSCKSRNMWMEAFQVWQLFEIVFKFFLLKRLPVVDLENRRYSLVLHFSMCFWNFFVLTLQIIVLLSWCAFQPLIVFKFSWTFLSELFKSWFSDLFRFFEKLVVSISYFCWIWFRWYFVA